RVGGPGGDGAIAFDAGRIATPSMALFDPLQWRPLAEPIGSGGRGSAWFVHGAFGDAVLRHYRRGGLVGRLIRDRYLFLGQARVRSFSEFALLVRMAGLGLPVPAPLAAGYCRQGMTYRADILIERIADARSLAELVRIGLDVPRWADVGRLIAGFHRAGVHHADLNAHNVLMDNSGRHYLIDFDRSRIRAPSAGWRQANLARLLRSLRKVSPADAADGLVQRFEALKVGYREAFR
ncbi:MAG: 3-deoxy-D-manno-octulosonic acid kinase, partial [Gammaproteobacteria bacterium HGW-Gammaproteobacteria-7]